MRKTRNQNTNRSPLQGPLFKTPRKKKIKEQNEASSEEKACVVDDVFNNPSENRRDESRYKIPPKEVSRVCQSCNQPLNLPLTELETTDLTGSKTEVDSLLVRIKALKQPCKDRDWELTCREIAKSTSNVMKSCAKEIKLLEEMSVFVKKAGSPKEAETTKIEDYFNLTPNYLNAHEVNALIEQTEKLTFTPEGSREVYYAGVFPYPYAGKDHTAQPTPDFLQKEMDNLPLVNGKKVNTVLVNRFRGRHSVLGSHFDNEGSICPWSDILNVSAGESRTMTFSKPGEPDKSYRLESGTLNIMTRSLQNLMKHAIVAESVDGDGVRYSYTYRHIDPAFQESSTLILSDSLCHGVMFGQTAGTLGVYCPGQRINAYKVEHLMEEDPAYMASFKSVIIALGINNLRGHKSTINDPQEISNLIEQQCEEILKLNPTCRIGISTVLPAQKEALNAKVSELNRLLAIVTLRLSARSDAVELLDFGYMGSSDDQCLKDTFRGSDDIHINDAGTKVIGARFKRFIRGLPVFRRRRNVAAKNKKKRKNTENDSPSGLEIPKS